MSQFEDVQDASIPNDNNKEMITKAPRSINMVTGIALALAAATLPLLWLLICRNFWAALDLSNGTGQVVCAAALGTVFIILGFLSGYGSIRAFRGTLWRQDSPFY
jgi:hypothetical protein